jgi:hypothetical protein
MHRLQDEPGNFVRPPRPCNFPAHPAFVSQPQFQMTDAHWQHEGQG